MISWVIFLILVGLTGRDLTTNLIIDRNTTKFNKMKLINSKEELDAIRPYKNYKFLKYPSKYPVLIEFERMDGGIGGEWLLTKIITIPENVDKDSFISGVMAVAKEYSESNAFGNKSK